ncbi:MAG: alpha/beta hydrolase [Acidobacteria bacterium]|nr:alpha/beta hydrolase [Acidobacteriota bacterium]
MTTGDVRPHRDFPSRHLGEPHDVLVYLPPGYERNPGARYPVLYLHDGQNVFDGDTAFVRGHEWGVDDSAERLIQAGEMEPVIVVAISNAGPRRLYEYTPSRDDRHQDGGGADSHGAMLVEELKPFIDATYRTVPGATGLGGSSLGGLITLYLGMRHPELFDRLAVMSPSLWWDRRMIFGLIEDCRFNGRRPRIWLDMGTAESPAAPHMLVRDARRLKGLLVRKGWRTGLDLHYLEAEGAGHSEDAWATRVPDMLRYLYPALKPE